MATLSIEVPESIHKAIEDLAARDGYSMNQFLVTAAAEKLSALTTDDYLKARADRADLQEFDRLMSLVPKIAPDPGDELPGH